MVNHQNILTAKVAILERLVRQLLKDRFLEASDPLAAMDAYAKRFQDGTNNSLDSDPNDAALMLVTENTQSFFDQLRRELETMVRGRKST
jgi:hypothetical protein